MKVGGSMFHFLCVGTTEKTGPRNTSRIPLLRRPSSDLELDTLIPTKQACYIWNSTVSKTTGLQLVNDKVM